MFLAIRAHPGRRKDALSDATVTMYKATQLDAAMKIGTFPALTLSRCQHQDFHMHNLKAKEMIQYNILLIKGNNLLLLSFNHLTLKCFTDFKIVKKKL